MKKILSVAMIFLVVLSTFSIFTPQVKAQDFETIIFEDDFESYDVGTFPSAGGWEIVWNGRGDEYQIITDAYCYSPTKSFQIWGQTGMSAVVQRKFSTSIRTIGYELAVMIESRSTEYDDYVGFFSREAGTWGFYYAVVYFRHADSTIAAGGVTLGAWSPGTWYKVKAVLDRVTNTYDVWIDDELKGSGLISSGDPYEINAVVAKSDWPGVKVYYDDVRVFTVTPPETLLSMVYILENSDPDYENPPFEDKLTIIDPSDHTRVKTISEFNIGETIGAWRAIAASDNGKAVVIAEFVDERLLKYDASGNRLFSTNIDNIKCVDTSKDNNIYALAGTTIYGDRALILDSDGNVIKETSFGGVDVAVDDDANSVWIVGADIKKLNKDLGLQFSIDPIEYAAVSVDFTNNGDAWVAERKSYAEGRNRLLKISIDGSILKIIELVFGPCCLRVDRNDNSFWVASWDGLRKYDKNGDMLMQVETARRWSVEVNQNDGSVWVAGYGDVKHYTKNGELISSVSGFSDSQAYVAVESHPPSAPDFKISVFPPFQIVTQGKSVSYNVMLKSIYGFASLISLNVYGLPTDASATFNPPSVIPDDTSTLTISTSLSTPSDTYILSIVGTSNEITHSINVFLIVLPPPDLGSFVELKKIYDVYYEQALYSDWWKERGDQYAKIAGGHIYSALMSPSTKLFTQLLPEILRNFAKSVSTALSTYGAVKTLIHVYASIECYAVNQILAMPYGAEQYRYADMRESLGYLVANTKEIIDAFKNDPATIPTLLNQEEGRKGRKQLIEDLYKKLKDLNTACYNYYNMAREPFIRKAYEIIRAEISSLRAALKSDYEYTTYLINGSPSRLSETVDAPLGEQRFPLREQWKIDRVNTFENLGEEKIYRVRLSESEVDEKTVIVRLFHPKDVDFGLYLRFGSKPTQELYDFKGTNFADRGLQIKVTEPQIGDYYILVTCPEGFGDYKLKVWLAEKGILRFIAESPVNILVIDPEEFKVGYNFVDGTSINEIPEATYTGPRSEPQIISIPYPLQGTYFFEVLGTGSGLCSLIIESISPDGSIIASQAYAGEIVEDAIYVYNVSLADEVMIVTPDIAWELEYFREFVINLPDDVFVTDDPDEFVEFKKEMSDKMDETLEELYENKYMEAIEKLNDMKEVIEEEKLLTATQSDLRVIINHIISSIETLQPQPD